MLLVTFLLLISSTAGYVVKKIPATNSEKTPFAYQPLPKQYPVAPVYGTVNDEPNDTPNFSHHRNLPGAEFVEDNTQDVGVFDNDREEMEIQPPPFNQKKEVPSKTLNSANLNKDFTGNTWDAGNWWQNKFGSAEINDGIDTPNRYIGEKTQSGESINDFEREDVDREDVEHLREFGPDTNQMPRKGGYISNGMEGDVDAMDEYAHDPKDLEFAAEHPSRTHTQQENPQLPASQLIDMH